MQKELELKRREVDLKSEKHRKLPVVSRRQGIDADATRVAKKSEGVSSQTPA